ncbi:MAG: hypothetical protein HYW48_05210 [Deltaproteobacteria bacterium]|nr:hypothetical protein [Deltaproteobacteria bacterium]
MLKKIALVPLIAGFSSAHVYADDYSSCKEKQEQCKQYTEANLKKFDDDFYDSDYYHSLWSNSTVLSKLVAGGASTFQPLYDQTRSYIYLRKLFASFGDYKEKNPQGADRVNALSDFDFRLSDIVKCEESLFPNVIAKDAVKKGRLVEVGKTYIDDMLSYKMSVCSDTQVNTLFEKIDEALKQVLNSAPSAASVSSETPATEPADKESVVRELNTDEIENLVNTFVVEIDKIANFVGTQGSNAGEKASSLKTDLSTLFQKLMKGAADSNVNSMRGAVIAKLMEAEVLKSKDDGQNWEENFSPDNFTVKSAICDQAKLFLVADLKTRPWYAKLKEFNGGKDL